MRYLLVDANHLASRCRHSEQGKLLSTTDGRRSGVVNGVIRGVSWARHHVQIDERTTICFWDGGRCADRVLLFPGYKGNRHHGDTEEEKADFLAYLRQIEAVRDGLRLGGVRQCYVRGTEADDLIAIFARHFEQYGHSVIIYSGDKDMHQLVSPNVQIMNTEGKLLDESAILGLWELQSVQQIPLVKALMGDASDAIPGVGKIGEKRARLVAPYAHLLATSDPQPSGVPDSVWKFIERVRVCQDILFRNLKLMLLPNDWESSFYQPPQAEEAVMQVLGNGCVRNMRAFIEFLNSWELKSVLENINQW